MTSYIRAATEVAKFGLDIANCCAIPCYPKCLAKVEANSACIVMHVICIATRGITNDG